MNATLHYTSLKGKPANAEELLKTLDRLIGTVQFRLRLPEAILLGSDYYEMYLKWTESECGYSDPSVPLKQVLYRGFHVLRTETPDQIEVSWAERPTNYGGLDDFEGYEAWKVKVKSAGPSDLVADMERLLTHIPNYRHLKKMVSQEEYDEMVEQREVKLREQGENE